jgi:hypothetical protein
VTAVFAKDPVVRVSSWPSFGGVTKSAEVNAESFELVIPLLKRLPLTYRWVVDGSTGEPKTLENSNSLFLSTGFSLAGCC